MKPSAYGFEYKQDISAKFKRIVAPLVIDLKLLTFRFNYR